MPYQPTWNNPYVTSNPYGVSPVMPTVQPYQQPFNGIVKVNGPESAMQRQLPPNSTSEPMFDNNGKVFYVVSTDGTGVFQLRGMNKSCGCCGAQQTTDYQVTFNGNIAIPTGGTVGPVAIALAVGGEPIDSSRAILTPAAVDQYGNVTVTKIVKVPWGCCPSLSVEYVNGSVDDPTFVPTPTINLVNGNLTVTPVNG